MAALPPALLDALEQARSIAVFTGAGVSAESGIPTFRDALTGLWERFDPMQLATAEAFLRDKALVWGWYEWRRMKVCQSQPNPAHHAIAGLQRCGRKVTVVTQNVDDLHERAGSADVIHLHGSLHAPRCFSCARPFVPDESAEEPEGGRRLAPPTCPACGGDVRPGVVWFGENLPEGAFEQALEIMRTCELLIVIGTSGLVQPAASLPAVAREKGARILQINPHPTPLDKTADWTLHGAAGEVLPAIIRAMDGTG